MFLCTIRWGLLVDHPPCVQTEIRRRESAHRWWPHPCQRVFRAIPCKCIICHSMLDAASAYLCVRVCVCIMQRSYWESIKSALPDVTKFQIIPILLPHTALSPWPLSCRSLSEKKQQLFLCGWLWDCNQWLKLSAVEMSVLDYDFFRLVQVLASPIVMLITFLQY